MRLSSLLPLALPIGSAYAQGCQTLNSALPKSVFSPDSAVYKYESQNFWSNTEILDPGCVFRPQSGEQLAKGLKELVQSKASFAVRGGGHMGIQVRPGGVWVDMNYGIELMDGNRVRITSMMVCWLCSPT